MSCLAKIIIKEGDVKMQELIFSIGDYVELLYNDKKYIGFIVGKKQGTQELMYDVLVERNNKSINTLSKNRVDTNRMNGIAS